MRNVFSSVCTLFLVVMLTVPNTVFAQSSPAEPGATPASTAFVEVTESGEPDSDDKLTPTEPLEDVEEPTPDEPTPTTEAVATEPAGDDTAAELPETPDETPTIAPTLEIAEPVGTTEPVVSPEASATVDAVPTERVAYPTEIIAETPAPTNEVVEPTVETPALIEDGVVTLTETPNVTEAPVSTEPSTPTGTPAAESTSASTPGSVTKANTISAAAMTVSPTSGKQGDRVGIVGYDFQSGERVNIRWGSATGPILGYKNATSTGAFSGAILVPANASSGATRIYLQSASTTTFATFSVSASPAAAMSVSPTSGKQGNRVSVSGTNFKPGERVNIRWGSASGPILGYKNATSTGAFSGAILVPANAPSGATRIYLQSASTTTSATFSVTASPAAAMSISPTSALSGAKIAVTGKNFKSGERVNIRWGSATGPILGYKNATSTGAFSGTILVPANASAGTTLIYLQSPSGSAYAAFTVKAKPKPAVKVSPATALPGVKITVTGINFKPAERVNIRWGNANGTILGYKNATSTGAFSGTILVPANASAGATRIYLQSPSGSSYAAFTVKARPRANVSISNTYGTYGDLIGITGWNFQPGEIVSITFPGNAVVGRVSVRNDGTFSGRVAVPSSASIGNNIITSRGGTSGFSAGIRYEVFEFLYADVSVTSEALPGALVGFSGSGFRPGEVIYVVGNADEMIGNVTASATGTISGTFYLTNNIALGSHLIQFANADVTYYADDYIKVIPWSIPTLQIPGTMSASQFIYFSGSGFGPNETVQIYSVSPFSHIATVTSDPAGRISGSTYAPNLYGGYLYVEAEGQRTGRWVRVMVYMKWAVAPTSNRQEYASGPPIDDRTTEIS